MKQTIAILLIYLFIFSTSSCFAPDDITTPQDTTVVPEDTTSPQQDTDTSSDETTSITPPTANEFIFDENKLPTIRTIQFHENSFNNPTPTDEELTNFLCEALLYYTLFPCGYQSAYLIPVDKSTIYTGDHNIEYYRLEPDYVKNQDFMETIISSYYDMKYDWRYYFTGAGSIDNASLSGDIYMAIIDMSLPKGYDTSIINISNKNINDTQIEVYFNIYYGDRWYTEDTEHFTPYAYQFKACLNYMDGKWKIKTLSNQNPDNPSEWLTTPPRSDFGKRITIIKPD